MTNPEISIVVPVYNTSLYLAQCLDTILNQTFRDIEVICVNDGSTDGSLDILENYAAKDNRIIVVNRMSSSGSAALPRNTGLDMARGKYIMFLDSDDYFDLTMLEKLHTHAEKVGADLVMCDCYYVFFSTGEISTKNTELNKKYLPNFETFSHKDVPKTIFQISNAMIWHKLILRETLIRYNLRFQLGVPINDDIYFACLILVLSERISIIEDRLIFYRINRYGAQSTKVATHKDSIILSCSAFHEYLLEHSFYEVVKLSLQNWTLNTMAGWLRAVNCYEVYCELSDAYKNDYFRRLNLLDINSDNIYDEEMKRFYDGIIGRNTKFSLRYILESVLESRSKIALYGAGLIGHNTFGLIKTQGKHEVVVWCDANADKLSDILDNPLIKPPRDMISYEFDAVIIAILDNDIVNDVKLNLINMGIESAKIYTI